MITPPPVCLRIQRHLRSQETFQIYMVCSYVCYASLKFCFAGKISVYCVYFKAFIFWLAEKTGISQKLN